MRLPRVRFTMRRLMIVIGLLAILMAGAIELTQWARARYRGQRFVQFYYVGDLIGPKTLAEEAAELKGSITPDFFWFGKASVTPYNLTTGVIVRHTREGHEQVKSWLRSQRVEVERGKR